SDASVKGNGTTVNVIRTVRESDRVEGRASGKVVSGPDFRYSRREEQIITWGWCHATLPVGRRAPFVICVAGPNQRSNMEVGYIARRRAARVGEGRTLLASDMGGGD